MLRYFRLPGFVFAVSVAGSLMAGTTVAQQVAGVAVAMEELEDLDFAQAQEIADPQVSLLHRYVRVQTGLLRRVCDLQTEQLEALGKLDRKWIAAEIANITEGPQKQKGVVRGIVRFLGGRAAPRQVLQPKDVVRSGMLKVDDSISELLTKEQRKVFDAEIEARKEYRCQAKGDMLLAILDRHVYLTEVQSETLRPALIEWLKKEDPDYYWSFYFQNTSYLPNVPQRILAEHLDTEQVSTLSRLNRYQYENIDMELQAAQHQEANFVIDD